MKVFVCQEDSLIAFFEDKLTQFSLNEKEKTDFITYWCPRLAQYPYTIIYFDDHLIHNEYPLDIEPKPDVFVRIFMIAKPSEYYLPIKPQMLPKFPQRKGFTVVEWGGKFFEYKEQP